MYELYKKRLFEELGINSLDEKIENIKLKIENLKQQEHNLKQELEDIENKIKYSDERPRGIKNKIKYLTKRKKDGSIVKLFEKREDLEKNINDYNNMILKNEEILSQTNEIKENINEKSFVVKKITQKYPEARSNIDFMRDVIKISPEYICFDLTNDKNLYVEMLELCKEPKFYEGKIDNEDIDKFKENTQKIIEEIKKPKEVPTGKYKIPHEYLFEELRKEIFYIHNYEEIFSASFLAPVSKHLLTSSDPFKEYLKLATTYLNSDGKIDEKVGKKIEEMYKNPETGLYVHEALHHISTINYTHEEIVREKERLKNHIFKEGLWYSNNSVNTIDMVVEGQNNNMILVDYIKEVVPVPSGRIKFFLQIPNAALDNTTDIPVFGCDFDGPTRAEPDAYFDSYILPEYVSALAYSGNDDDTVFFEENNIIMEDRKKYKYHYKNGCKKPMKENKYEETSGMQL